MGKIGTIIKVATVAGPAVLKVLQKYGPQLRQLARENPEVLSSLKKRITATTHLNSRGNSLSAITGRIEVLRDQVTYLFASANTPMIARQASAWRGELDALESLIPVVGTMSRPAQKTELKALQKRIDTLSSAILAATLGDEIEDAETVVEYHQPSAENGARSETDDSEHRAEGGVTGY